MPLSHRIITLTLLLVWLFATGHVVSEHGGMKAEAGHHEDVVSHLDDGHDHGPQHGSHAHDLTTVVVAHSVKSLVAMPIRLPLQHALVERLTAMLRAATEPQEGIGVGDSELDRRSSGWLLVCQTARPVRGPSLV